MDQKANEDIVARHINCNDPTFRTKLRGTLRKQSSGSVECTHQSRDPEACTYQSSDPEGYTYQSSDPEGCTYQSSDPEGCTCQSSDPEGYTYSDNSDGLRLSPGLLGCTGRHTEKGMSTAVGIEVAGGSVVA
ncbi:NBS-LRR type resistance protein [Cucumis melo var. makuwa]|uniref:NBS-LRR type resistance protein n=1 Tax=Cucumis melo var. makuwa TaxID=1194695 RepID=A0A5A7TGY8_CUCMM|nr:NBS-LRR type resistance protein [Cucumis melo var. makuwa]